MRSGLRYVTVTTAAAALIAAIASTSIVAQTGDSRPAGRGQFGPGGRGGRGGPFGGPTLGGLALDRLDGQLALTEAQRTQIRSLLTERQTALEPVLGQLRDAQKQLDAAILQTPADDGLIQFHVTAVSTLQAQVALARARTEAKIYQLLTPEKQQKLQQAATQRGRHGGR